MDTLHFGEDQTLTFPELVDSTMLRTFRSCPHKFFLEFMLGLHTGTSVHLVAGGAFAKGLEVARKDYYDRGIDADTATLNGTMALIEDYGDYHCPEGEYKTADRTAGALNYYFDVYPFGEDVLQPIKTEAGHAIEFTFAEPIPGTKHPETGAPILYGGRFDMLGIIDLPGMGEVTVIVDEKTTKQLGASWARQWDMRSQFTSYIWAAREAGYNVGAAIVRGIAIQKTQFNHAQDIQYRESFFIERWLEQVRRDLDRMIAAWEEGYWDFNLDEACSSYGGCSFKSACSAVEPSQWWQAYSRRRWDPLAKDPSIPLLGPEGNTLEDLEPAVMDIEFKRR